MADTKYTWASLWRLDNDSRARGREFELGGVTSLEYAYCGEPLFARRYFAVFCAWNIAFLADSSTLGTRYYSCVGAAFIRNIP